MRPWEGKPPEYIPRRHDVGATIVGCDQQEEETLLLRKTDCAIVYQEHRRLNRFAIILPLDTFGLAD